MSQSLFQLSCLSPQMTLASGVFCALAVGMFKDAPGSLVRLLAGTALVTALVSLVALAPGGTGPLVRLDRLGYAWQFLFYAGALPAALLIGVKNEIPLTLLLGSVLGMGLLAIADHLLMIFIGLELMSLPAYLLVALGSDSNRRHEAALKYFFAGGAAGSLFLMGMALQYAASGSLSLNAAPGMMGQCGQALMGAAALFKVGMVPLHFWLPDVYEAAAPEVAAFLSTALKAAGVLLLMRVAALSPSSPFGASLPYWGALTAVFGSLLATRQESLQRLLAYSSIAHAGLLILGVGAWAAQGAQSAAASPLFFYLMAYAFMSNGAFLFLSVSRLRTRRQLYGYAKARPALAALFAVLLLALAGIPPTGGFLAKLLIFWEAVKCGFYVPLAAAGLAAMIALVYYLGLIQAMYFEEPEGAAPESGPGAWVLRACAAGAVLLGLAPWFLSHIWGMLS